MFAIQLDETTDVSKEAQLLVYVRYPWEKSICEEFLFCKSLPERTTGEEVFKLIDSFKQEHSLKRSQCLAVCTDGAASRIGIQSGLIARIRAMNPDIIFNHCMIHCKALAARSALCAQGCH